MNTNPLKQLVVKQKEGKAIGVYSACSANEYVIEATLERGKADNSCVLIESTANQCDHNGGYTGMTPLDFKKFVMSFAKKVGFDTSKLFLGGDHLGPLTYAHLDEKEAMENAEEVIRHYVAAGFTKIHVDTSMKLASDDQNARLSDDIIAARGARLVKVAEETYATLLEKDPTAVRPIYIVGSEVPIPGGATGESADQGVQVTKVTDFKATVQTFENAFNTLGLQDAWKEVIAVVVQPGVEEKDAGCTEYDREKAKELMASIEAFPTLIFEGHSTDYQTKYKLKQLVEDGVGILKVGPALTYAMREGVFALAKIEEEALYGRTDMTPSNFIEVLEEAMMEKPDKWAKYYTGNELELRIKRKYSFSDRCRYYMPSEKVTNAKNKLVANLREVGVPMNLLSQFMPIQYTKVREGIIPNDPEELIKDRIGNCIDEYLFATNQKELF